MTLKTTPIRVDVKVSAKLFRRFALFDAFVRQRRWVSPTVFAGIFFFFALLAFLLRSRAEQAVLLACVLLGVGVVLPCVYFFSYLLSVRTQIVKMKLARPRTAYTLLIGPEGLEATVGKNNRLFPWAQMHAAYRRADCTYLYVSAKQGFLLPHDQIAEGPDALWRLLSAFMPPAALHGAGKGQSAEAGSAQGA